MKDLRPNLWALVFLFLVFFFFSIYCFTAEISEFKLSQYVMGFGFASVIGCLLTAINIWTCYPHPIPAEFKNENLVAFGPVIMRNEKPEDMEAGWFYLSESTLFFRGRNTLGFVRKTFALSDITSVVPAIFKVEAGNETVTFSVLQISFVNGEKFKFSVSHKQAWMDLILSRSLGLQNFRVGS